MKTYNPNKPAVYWLDRACTYEQNDEPRKAEMAFNMAVNCDEHEHNEPDIAPSLPRTQ